MGVEEGLFVVRIRRGVFIMASRELTRGDVGWAFVVLVGPWVSLVAGQ